MHIKKKTVFQSEWNADWLDGSKLQIGHENNIHPFLEPFHESFQLEIEPVLDNATGQLFLGNLLNILSYLHRLLKSFTFSQEKQDLNIEKSTNCYHWNHDCTINLKKMSQNILFVGYDKKTT